MEKTTQPSIPEVLLSSRMKMPLLGMGTASYPRVEPETTKNAALEAVKIGYRHFDTAAVYGTEQPLGEAIIEALSLGLIKSRDELFITSKLWCSDCHTGRVVPAIRKSLQNLKLEYLDLYLIHFSVSLKPGVLKDIKDEDVIPFDLKSVWQDMEDCQKFGLAKAIGVSNFSCKKLASVLSIASIPPAVNQVELNPVWQQKKLLEFCKTNGIVVQAYSPLGAKGTFWGSDKVMNCRILHEIAEKRGKSLCQICLRWVYEQGVCVLAKSFNPERMSDNLQIFDWELNLRPEEARRISEIPQSKASTGDPFISVHGPIKTLEELWDGEI